MDEGSHGRKVTEATRKLVCSFCVIQNWKYVKASSFFLINIIEKRKCRVENFTLHWEPFNLQCDYQYRKLLCNLVIPNDTLTPDTEERASLAFEVSCVFYAKFCDCTLFLCRGALFEMQNGWSTRTELYSAHWIFYFAAFPLYSVWVMKTKFSFTCWWYRRRVKLEEQLKLHNSKLKLSCFETRLKLNPKRKLKDKH